mgnify:CR=1 FL=1
MTKDYYRDLLSHLRQLLMRGQRRVAITFAQNNGLFDHALALSYLLSFLSSSSNTNLGQVVDNNLMISTIKKFITTTLSTEDPRKFFFLTFEFHITFFFIVSVYVFYTHLLQIATNILNSATLENGCMIPSPATGTTASAKIDRLESFIILLANDIKFDKVEIADKSYRNLIDLMIALLKDDFNYILPDELFNHDRFDCLLVNECLEFARFRGERLNPRLILRKLEFAFELFDFGFTRNASRYLTKIVNKLKDPEFEWKMLIDKKSKYSKWLLPDSIMNNEDDQLDLKLLQEIWSYQFNKIFTRINREMRQFDSPLFAIKQKDDFKNDENNNDDNVEADVDVAGEEDEDRTDVVEDIEDEEVDVELDTSESSLSKPEQQIRQQSSPVSTSLSSNQQENFKQHQQHSQQQNVDHRRHSTMMMTATSTTANTPVIDKSSSLNVSAMSPIEPLNPNDMIADNSSMQKINIKNKFELNFCPSPLDSLPLQSNRLVSQGPVQQGPRRSLPTIANHTFPRTLNPIMETTTQQTNHVETDSIHHQKSFDSLDSASPPSSPNDNFNMNAMQSALPSSFQNTDESSEKNPENHQNTVPSYPAFFQPPPPSSNDSTSPFDFISTNGHVTSIPSYDPYFKNNDAPLDNQTSPNGQVNHENNEFLQNTNNIPPVNNSVNETLKRPESNNNNNNNNGGESTKTSPSKSNNNTGLLGAILGRLKRKLNKKNFEILFHS